MTKRKNHIDTAALSSSGAKIPDCNKPGNNPCIVGIGASAGGLEAFEQFFSHLPPDTGLVFILVPHLEPTHKGMMPELLARHTKMKVLQVADGMHVRPNCIYVIPPNADLSILHGRLQVLKPAAPRGLRMPIDFFFRHLAEDHKEKAIGIILSGMGSDGTLGVKAIKEQLGMVMVQDPDTAKYDGMPRSAINTGLVDYIAPAEQLPVKLIQYVNHTPPPLEDREEPREVEPSTALQKVFVLLRTRTGNDFSCYKKSTINRRIQRRMGVHQFDNLGRYARFLQENPQEVQLLYKEMLIGVTGFFRDPGLFDVLRTKIIPDWLQTRPAGGPLRVWNPGCSTGEEAYSLSIVLKECLSDLKAGENPGVQLFATDIDSDAIDKARKGVFSAGIAADISPERLERFFVQEEAEYHIKKEIRDLVVFATQNLLLEPPFTKVDILCCRNLLIYLNAETQKKLMPLMHYALNPGGLLILGTAEGTSGFSDLFSPLDAKWKVFQRLEVLERPNVELPAALLHREPAGAHWVASPEKAKGTEMDVLYAAQRMLLNLYGPSAVIVNADGDIIYVNASTGKYLEPATGKANLNIFSMAREGLRDELGVAFRNALMRKDAFTAKGVKVKSNGGWTTVDITVRPLVERDAPPGLLLVVFDEMAVARPREASLAAAVPSEGTVPAHESDVEQELRLTRQRLQHMIEEMQATQEELRSANEELQSSNEELQSSNEELNSSKEEMQSLNEEMQTVNSELQTRMEELSQSNSDMKNLLNSTQIGTIFLDANLRVLRFTPEATKIVNLAPSDVGRPLGHFTTRLKYDGLVQDAKEVLDKLVPKEEEIEAEDGHWYNLRVVPYRTLSNVIDGVVLTFAEITRLKQLEASLRQQRAELQAARERAEIAADTLRRHQAETQAAREYAENIIATVREPLVVLNGEFRIVSASHAFYTTFHVTPEATEGRELFEIGEAEWEIPELRRLLEEVLPNNSHFQDFKVEHDFPNVGHKVFLLNARRMAGQDRQASLILLAMEEIGQSPETQRSTTVKQ